MTGRPVYTVRIIESILEAGRGEWDRLASGELPFLEWDWLKALEASGSVGPQTGVQPVHITLLQGGELVAAAPLYLKTHSEGEFVYDYFWEEAAGTLGVSWQPRLTGYCPATPAQGYRFLVRDGLDRREATARLAAAAEALCRKGRISSLNFNFVDPAFGGDLAALGYSAWEHSHFLWENPGYTDFDQFLAKFNKNQRKNIRKEYSRHEEQGIEIKIVRGEDAPASHFEKIFELYTITNDKFIPWDARFVNREFFLELERNFRRGVVFVEAREAGGDILALAMLVRKGGRLWGRYWGAYAAVKDLHFACCYYAPMDWAIGEGIEAFDPGAGSPHKVRRGFQVLRNQSYHKFFNPVLQRLFTGNISAVNQVEAAQREALNAGLPFAGR
jgi:predicted N-acyltransferase